MGIIAVYRRLDAAICKEEETKGRTNYIGPHVKRKRRAETYVSVHLQLLIGGS
jgi:hypothetical protein